VNTVVVDEAALDDPERLEAADPGEMLRVVAGSGAQIRQASALSLEAGVDRLDGSAPSRTCILTGIGSSAAAVGLIRAVVGDDAPVPLVTHPGGRFPRWVGPLDTVFAVSRSARRPRRWRPSRTPAAAAAAWSSSPAPARR
jgi:glucose/mannose-6-phosphate isomerase